VEEEALMFFILANTLAFVLLPSNLFLIIMLAGALLIGTRWRRAGIALAVMGLLLLLSIGFLPLGNLLASALESRFPPWDSSGRAPDGIVVLGGAISTRLSSERGEPVIDRAAGRIVALAKLASQFPHARIIYSGGNADLGGGPPETDFVPPLLDAFGIPRERVLLESRSRNTAENAAFSKEIAIPKAGERWLLVTSAAHMPRAVGSFRRAGFPVEAYPVDWRTGPAARVTPSRTFADGLRQTDHAVHEWLGLLAYWVSGRSSALLPRP
jgi:uncharacterized SAM-binding protein YcdF (DUF218 family)